MTPINLHNKKFKALENSDNGEVSTLTTFHYEQEGDLISAHYKGGDILKGYLVGKAVGDHLEFNYQHINKDLEILTGKCISYPKLNAEGKIILEEKWQWTCRDFSIGTSLLIEI